MSRALHLFSRALFAVVLLVAGLVTWRAYSRPHTMTDWDMAQAALTAGDRNAAVVHLRNAVKANPNHGEAYIAVGKLFLEHAEMNDKPSTWAENERAFPFLVQGAKLLPQNVLVQQDLLAIYLDRRQINEALEVAGRIADKLPKDPDVVAARAYYVVNQYERAVAQLTQVLNAKEAAHFQALELRAKIDDASENESHLQKLLDDVLDRANAKNIRDVAFLSRREHAAMANLMRRAVTQSNDAATAERRTRTALEAWNRLARVEGGGPNQKELISDAAEEVTWLASTYAEKYTADAVAFDAQAEAVRQFACAAECIRPATRMISVRRAYDAGDIAKAADLAAQGVATAPNRATEFELRQTAARIYVLCRSPEADKQIAALTGDREWTGYGRLLSGEQALLAGKPQDALAHFRSVLPLLGHTREVRAGLIDAFIAVGRWDEAKAELSGLVRRQANGVEHKPAIGEPPHRAMLLKLFQASPELSQADMATTILETL
jgi:tetratricopeptide (TPR) repeat protein